MKTARKSQGTVLIVSDAPSDATLVQSLLTGDVDNVLVATSAFAAADLFQQSHPSVLVLAYRNLHEGLQIYRGLYRSSSKQQIPIHTHRTIALCDRKDVKTAYDLCSNSLLSDYVQFWPNSYDSYRLLNSVRRALQDCSDQSTASQTATTLAMQAQRLAQLEEQLAEYKKAGIGIEADESLDDTEKELPIRPIVLIVDDDEFQSRIVGRILSSEHYHPEYASNGATALSIVTRTRPELILMDIVMPDLSGLEVVKQLKADPELAKVPIIMMTGKREREVVLESMKLGVADFIVKPIDRKTLLDKIGRIVAPGSPAP